MDAVDRHPEPYALVAELEDALRLARAYLLERGGFPTSRESEYVADVLRRAERWRLCSPEPSTAAATLETPAPRARQLPEGDVPRPVPPEATSDRRPEPRQTETRRIPGPQPG